MCVHSMSISKTLGPIWRCFGDILVETDGKIAPAWDQPAVIMNLMQETWCKIFYGYLCNTYNDVPSIQEYREHDWVVRVEKGGIIVSFAFNTDDEIQTVLIRNGVIDRGTVENHYSVIDALEYLTTLQVDESDREHGGDTTPTADTVVSPAPAKEIPTQSNETAVVLWNPPTATPWTYIPNG
jgi:hypothetical protein